MLVLTAGVAADRKRYRHVTSKLRSPLTCSTERLIHL